EGIAIHDRRLAIQSGIHFRDLTSERGEKLRNSLHRLDRPEHVVPREGRTNLRQLEIDDVAELALSVVGDADLDDAVAAIANVFMLSRVKQVAGNVGHASMPRYGAEWGTALRAAQTAKLDRAPEA